MTSLAERLASRWSPYQLNVGAICAFGLLMAIGLAGFVLLPTPALGLVAIPLFAGLGLSYWLHLIGLCPTCFKSPMRQQYGSGRLARNLRRRLSWPERHCSACGRDLRLVPND